MMTKWDTIQADVQDAYVYLDEQDAYDKARDEFEDFSIDDSDDDIHKTLLTLDWND